MLRVDNVSRRFGALTALANVSLDVAIGERHAIIGPNGAGKTTLFNVIAGDIPADGGAILFDGKPVTGLGASGRARRGLGRSFQQNTLFDALTVRENLRVAELARHRGVWSLGRRALREADGRLIEIAQVTGLETWMDAPVRYLPYGTRRQLEVAVARVGATRLLLLDEPTAGMAPEESRRMREMVARVSRDLALVIVEHDMDVVFGIADRITVLDRGRTVFSGSPEETRASPEVRAAYLGPEAA